MSLPKRYFYRIIIILLLITSVASVYVTIKSTKIENHVFLPAFSYIDLSDYGYEHVTVSGTLASTAGDQIISPLNTNEFACDNSTGECRLAQAEIFNGSLLSTSTESFPIDSWDKNFIVFKTSPESGQCVEWTYRIDRIKKELVGFRESATNYNQDRCMGIGLGKLEVKVVDGWEIVRKLRGY